MLKWQFVQTSFKWALNDLVRRVLEKYGWLYKTDTDIEEYDYKHDKCE
jgi:hypothetical protein